MWYRGSLVKRVYVLRLEDGEDILERLTQFVKERKVRAGFIEGVGSFDRATLGYFDGNKFRPLKFRGEFQIISLVGNTAMMNGEPIVHMHAAISDSSGRCFGGHVMDGCVVSYNCELQLVELSGKIQKKKEPGGRFLVMDERRMRRTQKPDPFQRAVTKCLGTSLQSTAFDRYGSSFKIHTQTG